MNKKEYRPKEPRKQALNIPVVIGSDMLKVKWCHTITCNKRATHFINETTDVHPGEIRQVGYCYGHYERREKHHCP